MFALSVLMAVSAFFILIDRSQAGGLGTEPLSRILSSILNQEVHVGSMGTNLLNKITLKNVSIKGPVSLTCPELRVHFSWANLLFPTNNLKYSVARLEFKHPIVIYHKMSFTSPGRDLKNLGPVPFLIDWEDASLDVIDPSGPWDGFKVNGLNGFCKVLPRGLYGRSELAFPGQGRIFLTGRLDMDLQTHWFASIESDQADLSRLQKMVPPALRTRLPGKFSGFLSGKFQISGFLPPKTTPPQWQVSGFVRHGTYHISGAPNIIPFQGRFWVDRTQVRIAGGELAKSIRLDGSVSKPWSKNLGFHLVAHGESVDIDKIRRTLPQIFLGQQLLTSGIAHFDVQLNGKADHPVLRSSFDLSQANLSGMQFPTLTGTAHLDGSSLDLRLGILGGVLSAQGSLNQNKASLQLEGRDLDLRTWATANRWRNIGGTINLSMSLDTSSQGTQAQGELEINHLAWASHRKKEPIKAKLIYDNHQLSLHSEGDSLFLEAGLEKQKVEVRRFHLISSQDLWVKGGGVIIGPEKNLDLNLEAKGLPIGDWPPLNKRYPEAAGHFELKGHVQGTLREPNFQGLFSVPDLSFKPNSKIWDLQGTVNLNPDIVSLKEVDVKSSSGPVQYRLELSWRPKTEQGELGVSFSNADPSFLREALKIHPTFTGTLNGEVRLQWTGDRWEDTQAKLVWTKGSLGPFSFEEARTQWHGQSESGFVLDELMVQQSSGAFSVQGSLFPSRPENPWTLTGQFQKARFANLILDGEAQFRGLYHASQSQATAVTTSPSLFLNDYSLGSVNARMVLNKSDFQILDANVSNGIKGQLKISLASHQIQGQLFARRQNLKGILHRLFSESESARENQWPSGELDAQINIGGTLEDVRIDSHASILQGLWRHVPFEGEVEVSYAHRALSIQPLRVNLASGGQATFEGFFDFESSAPIHLHGEAVSWPVKDALQLLGVPPLWSGVVQGSANWEGSVDKPKFTATIEGQHDAWGPLPGGTLGARLNYDGLAWSIDDATIGTPDGYIQLTEGSVVYPYSPGMGRMRLVANVRNIHLGPLTFFGGLETAGQWKTGIAEPHPLNWDLSLLARGLWINQERFDGELARCQIGQGRLVFQPAPEGIQKLSGEISFTRLTDVKIKDLILTRQDKTRVVLVGRFSPHEWNYSLSCQKVEAATLVSLFDITFPVSGPVDLTLKAAGPPNSPFWTGSFLWQPGTLSNAPFDLTRADFSLNHQVFSIKNFKAVRNNGYLLKGEGKFPLKENAGTGTTVPPPTFKLRLDNGDLAILRDVWSACKNARGKGSGAAEMKIVDGQPLLEGNFDLWDAKIDSHRYFDHLSQGRASLILHKNHLQVKELSATIGKGQLVGGGSVDFEGLSPSEYHLFLKTVGAHGVAINVPQLAIPPGPVLKRFSLFQKTLSTISRGQPKLDLELDGPSGEQKISGNITLDNTVFTYPPPPTKNRERIPQWCEDFINSTDWDIVFTAGDKTRYENELVDANITGSIHLQGRLAQPIVTGKVLSDQGAFVYAGEEFKIRHADFEIETAPPTEAKYLAGSSIIPTLEAEAEKDVILPNGAGLDTVTMTIPKAPLGEIRPRFQLRSNPGLGSEKAMQLALGVGGVPNELLNTPGALSPTGNPALDAREQQDQFLRAAVVQLFDASFASPLTRAIARRSGLVDYIRVYYQPSEDQPVVVERNQQRSTNYLKGSGLSFGKELTRRLFANYRFRVDEFQNRSDLLHEFELAYRLKNSLFLKASTELSPQETLGRLPDRRAILENQWRFSPPGFETAPLTTPPKRSKNGR